MTLRRLVIIAGLIAGMGLYLVQEHARIRQAGFQICELRRAEGQMVDHQRGLKIQVAELKQTEFIEAQVRRMHIELMRAPESQFVQIAGQLRASR